MKTIRLSILYFLVFSSEFVIAESSKMQHRFGIDFGVAGAPPPSIAGLTFGAHIIDGIRLKLGTGYYISYTNANQTIMETVWNYTLVPVLDIVPGFLMKIFDPNFTFAANTSSPPTSHILNLGLDLTLPEKETSPLLALNYSYIFPRLHAHDLDQSQGVLGAGIGVDYLSKTGFHVQSVLNYMPTLNRSTYLSFTIGSYF